MQNLFKTLFFEKNLIKKRNFFINLLILSSLTLVLTKNISKLRYASVIDKNGYVYILDRLTLKIELVE